MVEGNGLENRRASNGTEGSNPSLSAKKKARPLRKCFFLCLDVRSARTTCSGRYETGNDKVNQRVCQQ